MTGFDNKALLILPTIIRVDAWEELTWFVFNKNIKILAAILSEHYNMEAHVFNGSPILGEVTCLEQLRIVESVSLADLEFLRSCGLPVPDAQIRYPKEIQASLKKVPAKRGLSIEERVEAAEQRERFAEKEIIKKHYKVIFDFEFGQDTHLNLHPKANDGKLIIQFDQFYRVKKSFMNGAPIHVTLLLNNQTTSAPIESWRF